VGSLFSKSQRQWYRSAQDLVHRIFGRPTLMKMLASEGEHVRKMVLILGVVVASLGLSACGSGTKATIDSSVASLGAQPDLQVHFTATVSGSGTAEAQKVLGVVSMDTHYATPSGGPLSQANGTENSEVIVNVGTTPLLDLREIGTNLYVSIDLSAVNQIPGLPLTSQDQSELGALQLFLGGKWYEIPSKLLSSVLPSSAATKAKAAQDQAIGRKIFDALSKLIDDGHAKVLSSGGYSETGTLQSVLTALLPTIQGLDPSAAASAGPVHGTYTLTLTNSGSVATGGSISITAPEAGASSGDATVTVQAGVTHNSVSVDVPTNVTIITPALLQQLEGSASSV
jgi:hypothetical protein